MEHRLVRRSKHRPIGGKNLKIEGGAVWGCSGCTWFTLAGSVLAAAKAHRTQHGPRPEDLPLEQRLAAAREELTALEREQAAELVSHGD